MSETSILKVGSEAPDFTAYTLDGEPVTLDDLSSGGRHLLLVFLRHLG